jgi:demethylmenaquinone methyltransferase/2-methoxy-6-polyprenyl-1,4-benzoquinol methylase
MMKKAVEQSGGMPVVFAGAVSSALPFRSEAFDLVIISFATRNINVNRESLLAGFREFHRVLKPGGRFVNLETSQPPSRFLRTLFHTYVRLVVARVGGFISGSKAGYSYLSNTLVRFYGAEELARMFCEAGFSRVGFRRLTGGIVAVHEAAKESPGIGSTSGNRQ